MAIEKIATATFTKFRKKPVIVEAVQYANNDYADNPLTFRGTIPDWLQVAVDAGKIVPIRSTEDYWYLDIQTIEGWHRMGPDDWLIQGVKGELYPCKPDIFEKTYDPVS